jgi:2-C-methyl-D-erythritol 4-phosphate cytidylyltransferase/2-C-methyl-D-erythritol 2,4-cyclodiphosphate synthase
MRPPRPAPESPLAAAVVVAAGRGERMGQPDKIMLALAGRPILAHVLDALDAASAVRAVTLVAGEHTRAAIDRLLATGSWPKVDAVVAGGARRQDSVAAGVEASPVWADVIAIHDAARPLVPPELFDRCIAAAADTGAAIAAVPVSDTLKRVADGRIVATVDRDGLWAAQTPQAFRRALLVDALDRCRGPELFTDEAALCERLGIPVSVVSSTSANLKITHQDELAVAEALLGQSAWAKGDERGAIRTGIGYDAHRFAAGRPLVLGGVSVPHPLGLVGHSDADVLLHAIADALLGAAALGDIGQHFPPADPRFKDADSRDLLTEVGRLVTVAGFVVGSVDATVIAESPRIGPHVGAMRGAIAGCLDLPVAAVSVKATTNEGMGFVGRGEGIAALATATLVARASRAG